MCNAGSWCMHRGGLRMPDIRLLCIGAYNVGACQGGRAVEPGLWPLCDRGAHRCGGATDGVLWSGQMATLLGQDAIQRDTESRAGGTGYLTHRRSRLVLVIRG